MQTETDKGKLSAWERWELASFDEAERRGGPGAATDAELKPPSAEELAAIRGAAEQEGLRLGRDEGYRLGHAEGYAAGRALAVSDGQRLATLAVQLDAAVASVDQQVAEDLLALALELARQVVRQVIAVKPEVLLGVVHEALAQLPHTHAMIHLHPEDATLVRSYLGEQLAHAGQRILEDPRLARGDCLIEAGASQLDASVATRWKRVAESLGVNTAWLAEADKAAP